MRDTQRHERGDRRQRHGKQNDQRIAKIVVQRDHQQVHEHDRKRDRPRHARERLLCDERRKVECGDAFMKVAHDVRELVAVGEASVHVDDVGAIRARDEHGRGRERQVREIADAYDRAVRGAQRNRQYARERILVALGVDDLHLNESVRRLEFRRDVAAECGANSRRGIADRRPERARHRAVELDGNLR